MKLKHLISIEDLSVSDIEEILNNTTSFKEVLSRDIKKVPNLRGKTIINLFLEDSTRTRTSFEIAGKRLSADVINFSASGSSIAKGESPLDTALNLEAMKPDLMVVRSSQSGFPYLLTQKLNCSILNAGDGFHEHPSQALLDAFTLLEHVPSLKGLKVAIVGDIAHSRVARSNLLLLHKMGAQVCFVAPPSLLPIGVEKWPVKISYDLMEGIYDADVIMMLRIQKERVSFPSFPSLNEYSTRYGLNAAKLKECKKEVLVMHPGPVNRGVELSPDVADGKHSLILEQVTNGVALRMTLLYLLGN